MALINSIMTKNPYYTKPKKITVKGLMLHSVGCPQPNAKAFINTWNNANYKRACIHAFIDANSGDVYQTMPWNYRAPHSAGSANNSYIGVEMCEPSTIVYTGGSNWKDTSNGQNTKACVMRTYASAVKLFAGLCKEFKLDPLGKNVIVSHSEGHKLGIASNHSDVEHIWKKFGLTMDQFRQDVKAAMADTGEEAPKEPSKEKTPDVIYRVQVGAFSCKANADNLLSKLQKDGFNGFVVKVSDSLYKVQVGAYANADNAKAMEKKLKDKGYSTMIATTDGKAQSPAQYTPRDEVAVTPSKSYETIAKEVIAGKWGSGVARKQRLEAAGYDYATVQAEVNKQLAKK